MPPDEKSQKRVEKLFSDLEQIANQSVESGEKETPRAVPPAEVASSPVSSNLALSNELDGLIARILELEAKLEASEIRATLAETKLAAVKPESGAPLLIYEKEEIGYAYRGDDIQPLPAVNLPPEELQDIIEKPIVASGKTIGEIKVKPPAEHEWSIEEEALAQAVAQQASLQIQNLRLLAATERARAEAQEATRRFTHESWEAFLDGIHNSERIGYAYNQAEVAPLTDAPTNEFDLHETIQVLDEHVGKLFLKADPAHPLTDADKAMVSAVAQRIAQQVENLRLLAEASRARADAEEATRKLSRESWQAYTQRAQTALGYVYDQTQVVPLKDASKLEHINFTHPLTVRGETIGQIAAANMAQITPEATQFAGEIAERVSAQLERLRLAEEIEKRAAELATVATLSTTTSTVLNPEELLQQVVNLTKERFNLYHAQVYLVDEAWNTLLLSAAAGDIGKQMVISGSVVPMDKKGLLVTRAVQQREALIANDVRQDAHFQINPLLPDTRSEMAIPMLAGDKVLGVFDVHASTLNYFTAEDINIYSTLAAQVAVSLQNARLYADQAATVAQLRELDRLKSSFLANMSHELRTPLNSILGFADVMLEELDGPLTDYMRNDLGLIYKNGQHLLHLINDILDMSKIQSGKMNLNLEKFNLHEIIAEVTSITSPLASAKNIALFIDSTSDQEVEITADKIRIRQVMINLVNNSIKFTEQGKIAIHVASEENSVLISVKDTGIGIPADHLESIFQEFTQVDTSTTRKVGGTGLGLPISRRLIEMHGGRLWAESTGENGEGSVFYVYLPIEAKVKEKETPEKGK